MCKLMHDSHRRAELAEAKYLSKAARKHEKALRRAQRKEEKQERKAEKELAKFEKRVEKGVEKLARRGLLLGVGCSHARGGGAGQAVDGGVAELGNVDMKEVTLETKELRGSDALPPPPYRP